MFTVTIILLISLLAVAKSPFNNFLKQFRLSYSKLFGAFLVVFFVIAMISQPIAVFEGATVGLKAWWNIVFPSLLPFFIASELLMSLGIVHFMGVLLEPIMRPVFNVPGCGSFVMVVGFTSGCPIASVITARLRREKLCTRVEAERLLCFTNNSSPLFMLVAVSVGMFNNAGLGLVIAGAHYLANLTLGLTLKYYRKNDQEARSYSPANRSVLKQAFFELSRIHQHEKRPFGKILGDAVTNAVTNLLKIGGFIILFAVIIRILTEMKVISLIAGLLGFYLTPIGLDADIMKPIASGLFEMTLGAKLSSEADASLLQQLIAVAVILAWSGLSIHAQVASMIADTDIRMYPFVIARIAHAFIASVYTYLIWKYQNSFSVAWLNTPVFSIKLFNEPSAWLASWYNFKLFIFTLIFAIAFGLAVQTLRYFKNASCS